VDRTTRESRQLGRLGPLPAERCRLRVKVPEMLRLIEEDGWVLSRTRGSHRQYKHPSKPGLVTIPGKPGKDLPVGLRRSILKQAGLLEDQR
jgi:predicted RNA binding protein YcfA (HicA-like mRNA interferase family)